MFGREVTSCGVFKDASGRDIEFANNFLRDTEGAVEYFIVTAYKRVNDQRFIVGELHTFENPSLDAIALTVKNFKADYAEVHKVYEAYH